MRGKEHWPSKCVVRLPFSLFTCLGTTLQRLVTSPRDPGVVSLHVNAGHFSTTARRVTSPTWGPPPPCKQALRNVSTSCNESKHRYLTEIISFIGERVLGQRLIQFMLSDGVCNSTRAVSGFNSLIRESFGCGYDIVVPSFSRGN